MTFTELYRSNGLWSKHAAVIVDAYLAEHPVDDAEPVTEEWLRSVGFTSIVGAKPCNLKLANLENWPMYNDSLKDANWLIARENWWHNQSIPFELRPKTRGDLRRLCAALGVELKEQSP